MDFFAVSVGVDLESRGDAWCLFAYLNGADS